jgi:hypothetical protein
MGVRGHGAGSAVRALASPRADRAGIVKGENVKNATVPPLDPFLPQIGSAETRC